jgi:hypothetical protein
LSLPTIPAQVPREVARTSRAMTVEAADAIPITLETL